MHEPGIGEDEGAAQPLRGPIGQGLYTLCKAFAIGGGLLFVLLVLMSLISIVGRKLASMPIPGDIEIMQMGTAVASAAMLAYCEMMRHHLRVDFFTAKLSPKNKNRLDALSHLLLALFSVLIAWRTSVAAISLHEAGEKSMMLLLPVWPAVALLVPSFVLLAAAGFYNMSHHWKLSAQNEVTA